MATGDRMMAIKDISTAYSLAEEDVERKKTNNKKATAACVVWN